MDYVDLYLVHWPIKGKRKDTWKALEKLYADKTVRAIGVANYLIPFLDELSMYAATVPVLNQVELTPWLFQPELVGYCKQRNIQLNLIHLLHVAKIRWPAIIKTLRKYNKTPAQIVLRWNIEHNISTIPKSSRKERLQENFDSLSNWVKRCCLHGRL